jgi:hypothetical protein
VPEESLGRPGDVPGNVGFAPLPGAARVLDRATGSLVPCDATLCPHAKPELVTTYNPPPAPASSPSPPAPDQAAQPDATASNNAAAGPFTASLDAIAVLLPSTSYPPLRSLEIYNVTSKRSAVLVNRAPFSAQVRGAAD